jgi:uncharacterized protein YaaR (DUF327 family)
VKVSSISFCGQVVESYKICSSIKKICEVDQVIPSIQNLIQKFANDQQKKTVKSGKIYSNYEKKALTFEETFVENGIYELYSLYEEQQPEALIQQITEYGKRYRGYGNQQDLLQYKMHLGAFVLLVTRKAYRLKLISARKKPMDDEEVDCIIVEVEKRLVALLENFLSSQKQILDLIGEVEGLLFKFLV